MMGNASSIGQSRCVFVENKGSVEKLVFSKYCSSHDITNMLTQMAGTARSSVGMVSLRDAEGAIVAISATMPGNTQETPYQLVIPESQAVIRTSNGGIDGNIHTALSQISTQFNKAFKLDDIRTDIERRLTMLEKRVEREGLRLVEIEKCRKDITELKDQMYSTNKKMIDYNRLSVSVSDDGKIHLRRDVPSYPKYTLSQETIDYLTQPTFDIWHWEPNEMLSLLEHMYHELGLVQEFNINPITLKRWLLCVQENYRNNPFHNFRHCFCVTQMMYGMIHLCKLWDKMSKEDLGMLITAAVCHDLDHPGYNNTYQINARTELAVRYNDISPLENHHCAVAFQIISNPETNIFSNCDPVTFKRIRSGIIMLILATDMARHSEILESFKSKIEKGFDFSNDDHRNSMKMVLIKCCDISNEVRPFEVSEPWVDCLLEEYFNQSDREKEEGLPVAPFMDREKVTKPTAQIGFIKFVLIPMFETIAQLFPCLEEALVNPLKGSRERYETMKSNTPGNS